MGNNIVAEKYPLFIERTHSEMGWGKRGNAWGKRGK